MAAAVKKDASSINLTDTLTLIIGEIARHSPAFAHVDTSRLLVSTASNRNGRRSTIYGKLVPLRFRDGNRVFMHRGRCYAMPEIVHEGRPLLYIIYFYSPRFFDLPAREKLRVIFHELYHISPEFNGDIRRMGKVKHSHGHSRTRFDSHFEGDLEKFHRTIVGTPLERFLEMTTHDIFSSFDRVLSQRMKLPKPVIIQN
jgi:hypothetical protein